MVKGRGVEGRRKKERRQVANDMQSWKEREERRQEEVEMR